MRRIEIFLHRHFPALARGPLLGNVLALYAVQGLNYLMPLVLLPFLLRALDPKGYGAIMFAQSVIGYAVILVEFGFNFTAARDISVARHDPHEISRIFWTTTVAKSLLLVLAVLVIALVVSLVPSLRAHWSLYAASSLLLVGNVAFPQWYFQGLERLKDVALIQAVTKSVVTVLAIILVRSRDDLLFAAVILASPQVVSGVVGALLGKPICPAQMYRPRWMEIRTAMWQSKDLFVGNIATTLYLNTNTFLLGIFNGDVAVAMYSIAGRIVSTMQGLAGPVVQAVFPRASQLFAKNRPEAWQLIRQVSVLLLLPMAGVGICLLVLAPWLVELLGGGQYASAADVLQIMSFIPLLVVAAMILSQIVMVNIGLSAQLARIYLLVGILNLVTLPFLVTTMAELGAAISLLAAELLGPVLMGMSIWREERQSSYKSRPLIR